MDDVNDADQEDEFDSATVDDRTEGEDWMADKWIQSNPSMKSNQWGQKSRLQRNLSLGRY